MVQLSRYRFDRSHRRAIRAAVIFALFAFFGDACGLSLVRPLTAVVAQESVADAEDADVRIRMTLGQRGPAGFASAIADFARLRQMERVDALLRQAGEANLKPADLVVMSRAFQPAEVVRIGSSDQVSREAKEFFGKIVVAGRRVSTSEATLTAAIAAVTAESTELSVDDRIAGRRALLRGGDAAVAAIVDHLIALPVKGPVIRPGDDLLQILRNLGDGGEAALRQLTLYAPMPQRLAALRALVAVAPQSATTELVTAFYATDATAAEKDFAAGRLARTKPRLPTREQTIAFLQAQLDRAGTAARRQPNTGEAIDIWTVAADRVGVERLRTHAMADAYRHAADAAARRYRVGGLSPDAAATVMTTRIANAVVANPLWGNPAEVADFRSRWIESVEPEGEIPGDELAENSPVRIATALEKSLQTGDAPALVGTLRLIDAELPESQQAGLLQSRDRNPAPLVRAASFGSPRVRYEAAAAVIRLAREQPHGNRPYAGQNRVLRTLAEMTRLADQPQAVIVETRNSVVVDLQSVLARLGYESVVVQTVAELQSVVDAGGDLRLIVAKTRLADRTPTEMMDSVRRTSYGRRLPILFYADRHSGLDRPAWDAEIQSAQRWNAAGLHGRDRTTAPTLQMSTPAPQPTLRAILKRIEQRRKSDRVGRPLTDAPPSVVVVESDPERMEFWTRRLRTIGYAAKFAESSESLVQTLRDFPDASLVLADSGGLQDESGLTLGPGEVIRRVRGYDDDVPAGTGNGPTEIVFTGNSNLPAELLEATTVHLALDRPVIPAELIRLRTGVNRARRLPPLSQAERSYFRDLATTELTSPESRKTPTSRRIPNR